MVEEEILPMINQTLDVRGATCPGGGALWALLSHVREVPNGGSIELLTDDYLAPTDLPEWTAKVGWSLTVRPVTGGRAFEVARPG
jgi:TusA-related sulfurtransferase